MDPEQAKSVLSDLRHLLRGEVFTDDLHRRLYSTDASIYQQRPLGVARPRDEEDCVALVGFAAAHGIPLIPRAAGTSLAGQCVGEGLVVDVSRHMTAILEVDPEGRRARVQPGVILDDLNDHLREFGLMFGPETSTSNRCMIGGMIGNNAAGSHSLVTGTTRENVEEIRAVLADGSLATFGPVDDDELRARAAGDSLEAAIYRDLLDAVGSHRTLIRESYPRPEIIRRNNGYALDYLASCRPFAGGGRPFNLAPFLCGSEGTLALVTEARLTLIPRPRHNLVVAAHFRTLDEGTRGTVMALEHRPSAVELLDGAVLELSKRNIEAARHRWWVEGDPGAVLAIEFYDDDADEIHRRAHALVQAFRDAGMGYSFPLVESGRVPEVWAVRKAGLGLLTGVAGDVKPVTVIEDVAVAPADLPAYVGRMQELMERHGLRAVYYGHASVGELHVRPALSLRDPADLETFRAVAGEVADLVAEFDASLAGEHGVGRLRGPYLERVLGSEAYALVRRVKRIFDAEGLFNPGKIVDVPPMDSSLRMSPGRPVPDLDTFLDWTADQGLLRATEKCNGAGACRKSPGRGTMCPSYQATREELHSTRGRANLFRQLLDSDDPAAALTSSELKEAMELCLSCKACLSECPSSVDVARLKAEFLQHYHDRHGTPWSTTVLGQFGTFARLGSLLPRLSSAAMNTGLAKKLLDVDPRREVPALARQTFTAWWRAHRPHAHAGQRGEAVLYVDEFTNYTDPEVGVAVVEVLEAAGYGLIVPAGLDSGRTQMSKGLVRKARRVFTRSVRELFPHAEAGLAIVGIEPSAILGFRDEAPDLMEDEELRAMARTVGEAALLFEEFLVREHDAGRLDLLRFRPDTPRKLLLHGHCHQKSIAGIDATVAALELIPDARVEVIPSGCCGMAGSFGYHHYDVSMAIGEQVLFPAVRAAHEETVIVAPGTSCRHQIHDGTERTALHPAQVLRRCIALGEAGQQDPATLRKLPVRAAEAPVGSAATMTEEPPAVEASTMRGPSCYRRA